MPHISNADQIKRAADVLTVIGRRIPLTADGDHYVGRCPWHNSKSGKSFTVSPDKQFWYCFGCNVGGGVVDFIMKYEDCDYPTALETIASDCNIAVEYGHGDGDDKPQGPRRQDLMAVMDAVTRHYMADMPPEAKEYLAKRGVTEDAMRRWRIGYAKGNSVKDVADLDTLLQAGVLRRSDDGQRVYDPLAARITIPICDHLGRTVAFTARTMEKDKQPKYINTGDTTIFQKGRTLFGLSQSKALIKNNPKLAMHIVEGQLKAIACIENGIPAVAPGGTAFTPEQAALVHYVTPNVAWCPDPDEAGANALLKGASVARAAGLDVHVGTLVIPDAVEVEVKDPDDLMAMGLPVQYEYWTLVEWMYHRITVDKVKTIEEARRVASEIVPMIQAHPIPAVQLVEMRQLADLSGMPESSLARPKATDLARTARVAEKPPERAPIDMSLPPDRLLYAAVLQQGFRFDWRPWIPWIDLSGQQWTVLANIGHILGVAERYRVSVADAIGIAARPELRDYLMYWLSVREGREADIAALAATVARENRRLAAMHYARNGNFQYAEFLNNQ